MLMDVGETRSPSGKGEPRPWMDPSTQSLDNYVKPGSAKRELRVKP
jgi:hypothetical protein